MALTDIEQIKKMIEGERTYMAKVFNDRVTLTGFEDGQLEYTNVTEDSESVKIIRSATPNADNGNPITLNDQVPINLQYQKIVSDSVVVADDLLLTTIYVENDDYIINYENGTIERTSLGTTIPNGGTVYVWYLPFVVLTAGNDYNIDFPRGVIKRRAGSSIPDGATVYVDFTHSDVRPSDELIEILIEQMEAYIEPRLSGDYSLESTDRGLQAAAANYVMYAYCLSAGAKELRIAGKNNSDDLAFRWRQLSEQYLALSRQLFSKYLKVSTKEIGGVIENRFVSKRSRTIQSPSVSTRRRRF